MSAENCSSSSSPSMTGEMIASDHRWKRAWSAAGTPSISAITVIGSGNA